MPNRAQVLQMCLNPKQPNQYSSVTSQVEGKELGELRKLWKDIAGSEERLKLMSELRKRKIGFNEIEMFNLGLEYDLKSEKLRNPGKKPTHKITEAVMNLKIKDELNHHRELTKERNKRREQIKKI